MNPGMEQKLFSKQICKNLFWVIRHWTVFYCIEEYLKCNQKKIPYFSHFDYDKNTFYSIRFLGGNDAKKQTKNSNICQKSTSNASAGQTRFCAVFSRPSAACLSDSAPQGAFLYIIFVWWGGIGMKYDWQTDNRTIQVLMEVLAEEAQRNPVWTDKVQ